MTPDADSGAATRNPPALPRAFASPALFLLLIAAYFVWQMVLRLVTSNSAELDEGEQLLLTQKLAWGYGAQPPLYTWLQYPFIQLFGPSILPLTLFKNLLLFGVYAFTFLSARRLTRSHLLAVAATVSLLFAPQISWESQRDLTHTVLVTLIAAATLYVFLRLSEERRLRFFLAFGLCAALGTLSKYSYLLFLAGFLAAALSLRPIRAVIYHRWMLLALALAAILVAPHAFWAFKHQSEVLAATSKFHIAHDQSWLSTLFVGSGNLVVALAAHIGALLGIWFILCRKPLDPPPSVKVNGDCLQLLGRTLVVIPCLLALMIVCFRVTNFKDRWLLPLFICLPVYLVAALGQRLNVSRVRTMIGIGALVMVIVSILLPGRVWFAEWRRKPDEPNAPFDRLSEAIRPLVSRDTAALVAESLWMGGNLRVFFPKETILTPGWPPRSSELAGQQCLLIWDASRNLSPPENFAKIADVVPWSHSGSNNFRYVEAPLKFFRTNQMRLGVLSGRLKGP